MVNNPFAPPAPPNNLMGGTPAPNVQPMGQPQGVGATADRRKGFSDFLETTMAPPPSSGGGVQTQAQTTPVAAGGPPMVAGMSMPPQAGGMMGRPPMPPMGGRPPMGGPIAPPMGGPMPPAMNRGLGGMPQRPMMQRPPQPKGPPRRMADGGEVPRNTMIGDQPHMLAYINPQEAQLLKGLGGSGEPGPGGIPAYRNLDADLGIGMSATGKSYSGSDRAVSGGFDAAAATADDDKPNWGDSISHESSKPERGSVMTGSKDADLGVGATNTGKTYSGDDKAVIGGFDDDNDYGSSSEVTPFTTNTNTSHTPGSTLVDVSGVDWGALSTALGIDTSWSTKSGAWEPPGFDFDNDGISGEGNDVLDNNVSNPFDTSDPFENNNPASTPTPDDSDDDYVNVSSDETTPFTPSSDPDPVYYDAFGNEYGSQAEATAADNAAAAAEAAAQAAAEQRARERAAARAAAAAERERQRLQKIEDDRLARNRDLVLGNNSLVTGEASAANQDFFTAANQGSNFPGNITDMTYVRSDTQPPKDDRASLAEQMQLYGQGQAGNQYIDQVAKNYRDLGYSPEEASRMASEAYITGMEKISSYSDAVDGLDDSERTNKLSEEERNELMNLGYNEDMLNVLEFDVALGNTEDPLGLLSRSDRPNVTEADKQFNYKGDSNFIYDADENITYGINATKNKTDFENIVFHHTGNDYPALNQSNYGKTYDEERGGRFGYHFVIDKDGTIVQSAPLDARTNHIKSSDLKDGYENVTSANSIGISLVGSDDGEMTDAQMKAAQQLATQLGDNFNIGNENMLGQSTIQSGKQADEGQSLEDFFSSKDTSSSDIIDFAFPQDDGDEESSSTVIPDSDQDTDTTDTTAWYFGDDYEGELGGGDGDQQDTQSDQEEGKITTPGGTSVNTDTDTDNPEKQGLGNTSAIDKKMNLDQYAPLVAEIEKAREPSFFEGLMQSLVGAAIGVSPAGMIGRALYNDLLDKTQEERDAIIDEHIQAIADGNKPVVDKDGNYIGYTNFETDQAWKNFLPPTNQKEMEARADLNGNGIPDYEEFQNRYDKQAIAADNDPYGMTTATGFIVDEFFEADMDGDGVMEGYLPGVEYTVNNDGSVVRAGSEGDETDGLSFLGESLVEQGLIDPLDEGEEADGSGLPDGDLEDPFVPFDPTPEPDVTDIPESGGDDDTVVEEEKNFTIGEDGLPVCNDEGYVYSEELDMCVPMDEQNADDVKLTSTFRGRSSGGTKGKKAPELTRSWGGKDTPEARALGLANGGSVGLNAAADRFLRAMQGAR